MKILGADVETTGLDPAINEITEVGLVLFDTDLRQPVRQSGFLVKTTLGVSAEITALTGITSEMQEKYGVSKEAAVSAVLQMAKGADYFCAHNAPFDKGFLETECRRVGKEMPALPWVDTRTDLPPGAYKLGKSASLKYLACDHGFLYPAHRAVNDVMAMFTILAMYDINEVIRRSQIPNVAVRAVVSYDDRMLAKERGYHWKAEIKTWIKEMKEDMVDAEKTAAPFPVVRM